MCFLLRISCFKYKQITDRTSNFSFILTMPFVSFSSCYSIAVAIIYTNLD